MGGVISVLRIFSKRGSTSTLSIMSSFVQWEIIKNNHCQLIKRKTTKPMSAEPFNVRNIHSMESNGFINPRALSITPAKDCKGIVVRQKNGSRVSRPGKQISATVMKSGPRRVLLKLARSFKKTGYRKDLKKATLRRASVILRGQRAGGYTQKRKSRRGVASKKKPIAA